MYTVPGLPDGSRLLSSVLPNSVPLQLSAMPGTHVPLMLDDVPGKAARPQHSEVLTNSGASLRLSDYLRNHGLELVEVDTAIPQVLPAPRTPPPLVPPTAPPLAPPLVLPVAPPIAPSTAPPSHETEHQGELGTQDASPEVRHRLLIIDFTNFFRAFNKYY